MVKTTEKRAVGVPAVEKLDAVSRRDRQSLAMALDGAKLSGAYSLSVRVPGSLQLCFYFQPPSALHMVDTGADGVHPWSPTRRDVPVGAASRSGLGQAELAADTEGQVDGGGEHGDGVHVAAQGARSDPERWRRRQLQLFNERLAERRRWRGEERGKSPESYTVKEVEEMHQVLEAANRAERSAGEDMVGLALGQQLRREQHQLEQQRREQQQQQVRQQQCMRSQVAHEAAQRVNRNALSARGGVNDQDYIDYEEGMEESTQVVVQCTDVGGGKRRAVEGGSELSVDAQEFAPRSEAAQVSALEVLTQEAAEREQCREQQREQRREQLRREQEEAEMEELLDMVRGLMKLLEVRVADEAAERAQACGRELSDFEVGAIGRRNLELLRDSLGGLGRAQVQGLLEWGLQQGVGWRAQRVLREWLEPPVDLGVDQWPVVGEDDAVPTMSSDARRGARRSRSRSQRAARGR